MSSSDEEADWSKIKTITTFDYTDEYSRRLSKDNGNGSTQLVDDTRSVRENFIDAIATRPTAPVSLLVESLVHHLCSLIQSDKAEAEKLYQTICVHLHNMNLIDETYAMPEFDVMRNQFQRAMYELATVSSGVGDNALTLQIERPMEAASIALSRYSREFDELNFVARGGFGSVFKARNKLDGIEYAIKKVNIKYRTMKRLVKHFEEVKTFARLNHMNVVPYKTAWIEPKFDGAVQPTDVATAEPAAAPPAPPPTKPPKRTLPKASPRTLADRSRTGAGSSSSNDDDSSGETGSSSSDNESNRKSFHVSTRFSGRKAEEESSDFIQFEDDDGDDNDGDNDDVDGANVSQPKVTVADASSHCRRALCKVKSGATVDQVAQPKICWATLYIQMTFRPLTLRTWLDQRNKTRDFDGFYKSFMQKAVHQMAYEEDECDDNGPSTSAVNKLNSRTQQPRRRSSSLTVLEKNMSTTWTSTDVTVIIFKQALNALHYIHSHDIVHHDIKPSNIFIDCEKTGELYIQLGDFGLACPLNSRHARDTIIGTPIYAAPEQLVGQCNAKSDLFSLGIILVELLTPFTTNMERSKTLDNARKGILPEDIPPKFRKILRKMLQDQRARPDVSEMREYVKRINFTTTDDTAAQHKTETAIDETRAVHNRDTTHATEAIERQIEVERHHTITTTKRTQIHSANGAMDKFEFTTESDDLNVILQRKLKERRLLDMEIEQLQSRMIDRSAFD